MRVGVAAGSGWGGTGHWQQGAIRGDHHQRRRQCGATVVRGEFQATWVYHVQAILMWLPQLA